MSRTMRRSHRRHIAVVAMGAVSIGLVACSSGQREAVAIPAVFDLQHDPTAGIAPVDPTRTNVLPADALRGALEDALTWHGITLVQVMRSARSGSPDLQTWIDALAKNTDDITAAVGLVYGPVGAKAFNQQWAQHTQFLLDYAEAIGHGDHGAAETALAKLRAYAKDNGSLFQTATGGILGADAVQGLLNTHIDHMIAMITADDDSDVAGARDAAVMDNGYLQTIGGALAGAIAQQQSGAFPGSTDTPTAAYCTIVRRDTGGLVLTHLLTADATDAAIGTATAALTTTLGADITATIGSTDGLRGDAPTAITTAGTLLQGAQTYAIAHVPAAP